MFLRQVKRTRVLRGRPFASTSFVMPLVDISPLLDAATTKVQRQPTLDQMRHACDTVGFFTIPVSVLPSGLVDRVYRRADEFNALPEEVKRKYHVNLVPNSRGWTPLFEEPSYVPGVVSHLEGYDVAQELPASFMEHDKGLGPNVWPVELPEFRKDVMALYDATTAVTNALFEGFAEMLDLPRDTFRNFNTTEAQACMRLLTYPENSAPQDDRNVGIAAHTDFECFTIIHQNNSGLQLTTRSGEWTDAPVMADRLVVMVGDVLERWTNGQLKATPHRVLNTQAKRQSIVRFNGAEGKAVIAPLAQFVSATNPAKFSSVTQRQHIENELNAAYGNLHDTNAAKKLHLGLGYFSIPTSVLPPGSLDRVYRRMDDFNALPVATKQKYHIKNVPNNRGWTPLLEEPSYIPGVASHLEGFDLARDLPASYLAGDPDLGPNVWPAELPAFRTDVEALYDATTVVANGLFEGFAEMLELPRHTFRAFHTHDAQAGMRLLTYPENSAPIDGDVGISEHTDYECFTILHQTNWGLQLTTRQGDVVDVPVVANELVVMIGDLLERWTNGILVATPHRVLNTPEKRQSIVRFSGTRRSTVIAPLPPFVSESTPAKYPPVTQRQHSENVLASAQLYLNE
ncbi:2OG-Fe(II) oxygenase superfamily protein [Achlya hypogyna]|uniref:2OG-Fe(II) oxygenase superfamily protein n=1 Tax=Achlya hypogyna TaxID=1202772 RepID=A0A1V9YAU3_ACHHY|nr:2OG-Fe(II) oxygenase superfamily protein [Achlya hypogyna]